MSNSIAILGAGESGTGAAVLATKKGHRVFVSDKGLIENKYKEVLSQYRIEFEEGKYTEELIFAADEIIKSPGIPDEIDLIRRVKALSKPVISELEFAGRYTRAKKLCVTGSNGKTTTTLLLYHILKVCQHNLYLGLLHFQFWLSRFYTQLYQLVSCLCKLKNLVYLFRVVH